MGFQKCPVCEGSGKLTTEFNSTCHVCQGYGIISDVTGEPPKKAVTTNTSGEDFGIFIDEYVKVKRMPRPDWDELYLQRRYGDLKTDMFKPQELKWRKDKCECSGTSDKCVPIKTEE